MNYQVIPDISALLHSFAWFNNPGKSIILYFTLQHSSIFFDLFLLPAKKRTQRNRYLDFERTDIFWQQKYSKTKCLVPSQHRRRRPLLLVELLPPQQSDPGHQHHRRSAQQPRIQSVCLLSQALLRNKATALASSAMSQPVPRASTVGCHRGSRRLLPASQVSQSPWNKEHVSSVFFVFFWLLAFGPLKADAREYSKITTCV